MIRVVGLPLFLVDFSMAYRLILVGLPLFTAAFLIIRFAGYNVQDIYLTISFPLLYFLSLQLIIGITGIPLGLLEHKLLATTPAQLTSLFSLGKAAFILVCFSGFLEELIFRGVLLRAAGDHMGYITGSIYASCLFAALQIPRLIFLEVVFAFLVGLLFCWMVRRTGSIPRLIFLEVVFAFLVGLLFCWMVRRTGSIWGVALAHGLINMILYLDLFF
jgi:membrane protease YdiL (CAAX protease family)